jgi:hypothetical protein
MAVRISAFNSTQAFVQDGTVTPFKQNGFSGDPTMKENMPEGITWRLNFQNPGEPDVNYFVCIIVEEVNRQRLKFGILKTKHTDFIEISGGSANGETEPRNFMVLVMS